MELSIVIPALNEAANLRALIPAIRRTLEGIEHEIVVVDGGSTDGTGSVAAEAGARVIAQKARGYGRALAEAFRQVRGAYVVTMDADASHEPKFILDLWARRREADVVIASRYVEGGASDVSGFRAVLSRILNGTYRRVLSLPLRDMSSGYRLYRAAALREVEIEGRDFEALEEVLIKLYTRGFRVIEAPFVYRPRAEGRSKAKLLKFGWRLFLMMLRLWKMRNSADACDYDDRAFDSRVGLQRYWQRHRHRIITGWVKGPRVLDVGCGSSRIIRDVPAVGLDMRMGTLRHVKAWGRPVVRASVHFLPFRADAFDTVIFSQVIEHLPPSPRIMGEISRVTRGRLIIGTPDYARPQWPLLEFFHGLVVPQGHIHEHITHFTRATLRALVKDAGFAIEAEAYVGGCELNIKAGKTAKTPRREAC